MFFEVLRPESISSLMSTIVDVAARDTTRRYVWRGQGDASWGLAPSLYRRIVRFLGGTPTEKVLQELETDLMASSMGLDYFDGKSHPSTYALLQHHGAATRFLDVTRDPMIALWFAIENEGLECDGALIGIDVTDAKFVNAGQRPAYRDVIDDRAPGVLVVYEPPWKDDRVKAQRALFICSVLDGSQTPAIAYQLSHVRKFATVVVIPHSLKGDLRQFLDANYGLHPESMFPDLDGFAASRGVSRGFRRLGNDLLRWG